MTPEEREKAERRARRQAELEDGCCVSVGGMMVTFQKFPPPNTEGMTPEERTAAWAKWRAAVDEWVRETNSRYATATPATPTPPAQSPTPPEVPAS